MPSTQNPAYYERSSGFCHSILDTFFKYLTLDDAEDYTGDVDAPVGFVQIVQLDDSLISGIVNEHMVPIGMMESHYVPEPGWYVTRQDDNGLIWAMSYGPLDSTFNEENARADFAEAESVFDSWSEELEEDYI